MARFTFLSWSGAGNQPPAIGTAQALRERDYHVVFAGYEVQRALFDQRGFDFTLLETASREWRDESAENMVNILVECVWASHQHLNDVEQVICEGRPDVMVVDRLMFGALRGRMRTLASPILTAAQEAFEDEFDSTDLHPAAVLYLERANDDLAAQDDKVGAGIPIAGSSKAMRHCAKLPRFEH